MLLLNRICVLLRSREAKTAKIFENTNQTLAVHRSRTSPLSVRSPENRRPRARSRDRDAQPQESARCSSCVRCTLHGNARLCSLLGMIMAIINGTDTANSHRESNLVSKSAAAVVFLRAILPRVQLHKATFLSKQLIIDITPILG